MYTITGRHGMYFFLITIAFTKKDCTFWQSMNDCRSFTPCFWHSLSGTCNNMEDWHKEKNHPSICADQRDMFECYGYMNCFWRARRGTCEDQANWQLALGPTPDPMSRSCSFWDNSQDCWQVEKCFFDRRENLCKAIAGGDSGASSSPPATGFDPAAGNPNGAPNGFDPAVENPNIFPNGDPMAPPGAFFNGDTGVPISSSSAPSLPPTEFWEPMNMCESLRDRKACAYGDGCIWDVHNRRCLQTDGDCTALNSEGLCFHNEECIWDTNTKMCTSTCASITEESPCAYSGEECFWDNGQCVAINISCDWLSTPSLCVHNEMCYWNQAQDKCKSVFTSCSEMEIEPNCGKNDQCRWNDVSQECENLADKNTLTPFITCEDITDVEICAESESTEHHMPCEWDKMQNKCVEFDFDCETFETADTCNGAKFRHIECYWKGECDQRKLAAPVLLQKVLQPQPDHQSSAPNYLAYALVFLIASIVGLFCGAVLIYRLKSPIAHHLSEPLDVSYPQP